MDEFVRNQRKVDNCKNDYKGEIPLFFQTPVLSPDGSFEVNFKGETGSKITIKITKKDETAPSTVSSVEVKACTQGKTPEPIFYHNS